MTLSPEDFEHLVADLLSHEWNLSLEQFKSGKDQGIDLRNTRVLGTPGTTIIQCKLIRAPPVFGASPDREIGVKEDRAAEAGSLRARDIGTAVCEQ